MKNINKTDGCVNGLVEKRKGAYKLKNGVNTRENINLITKTTELAMNITMNYVNKGDEVVDATAGNGNDTLAFARAVGEKGKVYAFDVQEQALENTAKLLFDNDINVTKKFSSMESEFNTEANVQLIQDSHEHMSKYCQEGEIAAIMFNLGYLPLSDKSISTSTVSTLIAIQEALHLIKVGGIVTVVMYCGHEAGRVEKAAILDMTEKLSSKEFHVVYASMHNQGDNAPEILWITKKR